MQPDRGGKHGAVGRQSSDFHAEQNEAGNWGIVPILVLLISDVCEHDQVPGLLHTGFSSIALSLTMQRVRNHEYSNQNISA